MEKYGKILSDGSLEIATSVVKYGNQTFYRPNGKTLEALGYLKVIEVEKQTVAKEGYHVVDQGYRYDVDSEGKKIITNAVKYLEIVDNPPNLSDGLYIRHDYWKEIDSKWVHVYDVASERRHKKHKNKHGHKEEKLDDDDHTASKFEEQIALGDCE